MFLHTADFSSLPMTPKVAVKTSFYITGLVSQSSFVMANMQASNSEVVPSGFG